MTRSLRRSCRVRGSLTVEAALVFSTVLFSISAVLGFAFRQRDLTLAGFLLNESSSRAARIEAVYDPDGLSEQIVEEDLQERLSSVGTLSSGTVRAAAGLLCAVSSLRTDAEEDLRPRVHAASLDLPGRIYRKKQLQERRRKGCLEY